MAGIRTFHRRILNPVLVLMQVLFVAQIAFAAKPPPPPLAPSIVIATPYSNSQINLGWNDPNTGSGSPSESGYEVERVTPPSTTWTTVFTSGPSITSWSNTSLAASTTYSYRVRAFTVTQRKTTYSGYSPVATATTLGGTNLPPLANAGPSQSTQTLTSITFNGSGSSDPDGTIASYAWNFGDGATASGVIVSHAYARAGTYTVTLTVADNLGATGSATTTATVLNRAPLANAGPDQTVPISTLATLNGSGSSDPDGTIVSYFWNFGDGITLNSGNVAIVSHTYTAAGVYNVTLTVTDNNGTSASDQAVITVTSAAAGGAYRWADRFGGSSNAVASGYSIAVDTSGNVIVVGTFTGTVNLGGGPLVSAGSNDIFVAKYSPAGAHLWSKSFGATIGDQANAVAVDASGNVFVAGSFRRTLNFGGGPLTAYYSGFGEETTDFFVTKFSPSGAYLWSKVAGSFGDDSVRGVAVDSTGSVVVTGTFVGMVNFGGTSLLSASNSADIFVAKYSAAGQLVWALTGGGMGADSGYGIAIDRSDNVVIVGYFEGTGDFGGGPVASAGGGDIVLAKYSSNGVHLWSKALGGTGTDSGLAVAVDTAGNIVLTGYVQGTVDFGGGPSASIGSLDAFMAKYSPTGTYVWSTRLGGTSADEGLGIATDTSGNIFLAGTFQGTANFGSGAVTSAGSWDVVLAKFSANGAPLWTKRYGTVYDDLSYGVATDANGNAFFTGYVQQGTVNFGGGPTNSVGWTDLFILSLGP